MGRLTALVAYLSLDICAKLVGLGIVTTTLTVTGASNASPIVLTSVAHGLSEVAHVVVSGVGGNTAANGTWIATPTDANSLSLSTVSAAGVVSSSVGSGTYTSGGTMQIALVNGRVLLGRQRVVEEASAPRIVFVPTGSTFGPKSVSNVASITGNPTADLVRQWQQRSIATDQTTFEVHVWGVLNAASPSPEDDFDATETLYDQVIASTHLLTVGRYTLGKGEWADQKPAATQWTKMGHEFVFTISLARPVLDVLLPLVPSGTVANPTTHLQPADGSASEIGCTG